jgi:hypothetical protein
LRKLITITAAIAAIGIIAIPSIASAAPSPSGATHGTFGYLGAKGERHDLGQGDNMGDAYLGANPATGLSNASVVGNGTPEPHDIVTPLAK